MQDFLLAHPDLERHGKSPPKDRVPTDSCPIEITLTDFGPGGLVGFVRGTIFSDAFGEGRL